MSREEIEHSLPEVGPGSEVYCRYCGSDRLRIEWREKFVAKEPGTWSLAGVGRKTVATRVEWPWMVCDGCGHESEGKRA